MNEMLTNNTDVLKNRKKKNNKTVLYCSVINGYNNAYAIAIMYFSIVYIDEWSMNEYND